MKAAVYLVRNTIDGTLYVGKSIQPEWRWKRHCADARRGSARFYRAIRKHGEEAFHFEVLEWFDTEDEAFEAEEFYVGYFKMLGADLYNMNDGGKGGRNPSPETRAKLSEASRNMPQEARARINAAHLGSKHSVEARAKMSEATRGRKKTPEHRAKLSEAVCRSLSRPEVRAKISAAGQGRKHTPEARAKMSAASKRRWIRHRARAAQDQTP